MELMDFLKQLFIVALGGCAALVVAFYLIWPKVENYLLRINGINESKALTRENLQVRFTAYERLILLVNRISPKQVMQRNHNGEQTIAQFKRSVMADIEQEYQHNLTQQLYVTDAAWAAVKELKENTATLFRNASQGLPSDAPLDNYIGFVLRHVDELEINPYEAVQIILKKELSA